MNRIVLYSLVFAAGVGSALAQTPGEMLEQKLQPGAEIFDAHGRPIGIVTELELGGGVIVREVRPSYNAAGNKQVDVLRVIPPGTISWTGYGLKSNLTIEDVGKLPSPDNN